LNFDTRQNQWVEETPPLPGTPEAELRQIRISNAQESYGKALRQAESFVKKHSRGHPLYPEVLLERAEALIGQREFSEAHKTLQEFLGEFSGMALTSESLRMEFVVAEAFLSGAKRKVWRIFRLSGVDLGYEILDEISSGYPDSEYAPLAIKAKADHLFKTGEHGLAEVEYARLLRDYPQSRYHQFALRRAADAALASFGGVEYDEAALVEAEERFRDYDVRYTAWAKREGVSTILDGIRESRAEKEFQIGAYYEKTEHLGTAVFYYQLVVKDWPGTIAATKAGNRLEVLGAPEPAVPPSAGTPN
jgi:outer membrane protein assembly factor BamD (BamD/ComL family)